MTKVTIIYVIRPRDPAQWQLSTVICSKVYFHPAPSEEGRARGYPTIADGADFIVVGPKYLALPDHKKTAHHVRRLPTIVD